MGEALFGGVGEIDFDNIINMENIIMKNARGLVSGSAFYLDKNVTFNLKGTDYCSITEMVIFFYLLVFSSMEMQYFSWLQIREIYKFLNAFFRTWNHL